MIRRVLHSVGPALVVAAVVLGPGSILTSSKVGANIGLAGLPVIGCATVLMAAMVALSARLGAVCENSLCDELSARCGRPVSVAIGLTLFTLVALFQSSNNIALIGGLQTMFDESLLQLGPFSIDLSSDGAQAVQLIATNAIVIGCLYFLRNLYSNIERAMKLLIGMMTAAFLLNFAVVFRRPAAPIEPSAAAAAIDWLALMGLVGTTYSVGGAFYQAYLVREKGWGLSEVKRGLFDSIASITVLGLVTAMILLTSWRVFYGQPAAANLANLSDVARQLEPLFGRSAKIIFCVGIFAGALSSFLVNALIGGTVMSDSLGKGSRLEDGWPLHLTTLALVVGMLVAIASLAYEDSTVHLITIAQACTVIGIPALAAALIYLGTRPELTGPRSIPVWMIRLAQIGFCVSCGLAWLTARRLLSNWT